MKSVRMKTIGVVDILQTNAFSPFLVILYFKIFMSVLFLVLFHPYFKYSTSLSSTPLELLGQSRILLSKVGCNVKVEILLVVSSFFLLLYFSKNLSPYFLFFRDE